VLEARRVAHRQLGAPLGAEPIDNVDTAPERSGEATPVEQPRSWFRAGGE
jgi:hypothetical protein